MLLSVLDQSPISEGSTGADALRNTLDLARLADERYRADVLAVIKPNKHARELLAKYLDYESDTHPLLYLKTWVRQQLAAK